MAPRQHNVFVTVHDHETGETWVERQHNTVCIGWHELLIRLANPEDSIETGDVSYDLVVGTDDGAPQYDNRQINSQIAAIEVTDFINEGTNLYTSTFLDSGEANSPTGGQVDIVEAGVQASTPGDAYLCNHSTIPLIEKNQQKTATIEAVLELNNDTDDP